MNILVRGFFFIPILWGSFTLAQDPPMREPACDARMIATYAPTLSKEAYLEVINAMEMDGAIDTKWAAELRKLIEEAYTVPNIPAWVRSKCAAKEEV